MDTKHMLFFNLLLILSWINISSSVEELVSFGVRTREDVGSSASPGLHTITVWFNRNVYQCTKTPNSRPTTYTCNAAPSLLGCDSHGEIGARMLVQNPSVDASILRAFITTTGNGTNNVNYEIEGLCVNDSAVTQIALGARTEYMDNQTFLCQNGYTHFNKWCIDSENVGAASCGPWRQVIHFDLSQPNVIIDNALWEDGTSVTISTDSNEACKAPYFTGSTMLSWNASKTYCASHARTFASIHSNDDWQYAKSVCEQEVNDQGGVNTTLTWGGCWIGLTDQDSPGTWAWDDGTTTDYGFTDSDPTLPSGDPWDSGEPDATPGNPKWVHLSPDSNYTYSDLETLNDRLIMYPLCNGFPPTAAPSVSPTKNPSTFTQIPTANPSVSPTLNPSLNPSTFTNNPSVPPTTNPTTFTQSPTFNPTTVNATAFSYCLGNDVVEGWYDGDSIDIANSLWIDKSSSQNDATINNNVGLGVFNGNQTTHELFTDFNTTAVYGATTTQITFNVALHPTNHTVFNYCKYRDVGTKRRILQGSLENSLFGFWNGRSGVGYIHPVWISDSSNHFGTEWVLSAQQRDLYRGNRIDFTVGTGTFAQTNQLMINLGAYPADTSDWACTEIIVLNQKIPLHEIQCIENYLVEKYSTNAPTTAPTQQTPSPTRHLASESFKYEFGFITATAEPNSFSPDTQVVTLYWDTIMFQCTVIPLLVGQYYGCDSTNPSVDRCIDPNPYLSVEIWNTGANDICVEEVSVLITNMTSNTVITDITIAIGNEWIGDATTEPNYVGPGSVYASINPDTTTSQPISGISTSNQAVCSTSTPTTSPSSHPSANPSSTPTRHPSYPSLSPTNYPSQSPIVYTGPCLDIDGGNWTLVRHAYNQWHPATDNLEGTDEYGTYVNDPESMSSWSIPFDEYLWPDGLTQFMFSDGNCSRWLITTNDQFTTNYPGQYSADILSSYTNPTPYTALWYNRAAQLEDPWISVADGQDVLYGENDNPYNDPTGDLFNVWIRILPTNNPTTFTQPPTSNPSLPPSHHPSSPPTNNPSSPPTVTKHWVEIATELAGAGPTLMWRNLAFDFYSQYPSAGIAAYKLEFDGAPGSYSNWLTFELDDKNLNLFEDSAASLADYHAINVLDSTLGAIPVGNHHFCKQCGTSRTDVLYDSCWAVTQLSDTNRDYWLGCNLGSWVGSGIYYGSHDPGPVCPACFGGAFAGYKANSEQKGGLPSVGLRLSILVEPLTPTNTPTGQPISLTVNPSSSPTSNPSSPPTVNPSSSPTSNPSINPSASPSADPSRSPTNHPSQSPIIYTGPCVNIGGGNWTLVRHAYNQWHPATDNLEGTDAYGTYDNNAESMSSWSIPFDQYLWPDGLTQFMFSDGNCSRWLITTNDQFTPSTNDPGTVLSSYTSSTPYNVSSLWNNRGACCPEDPWIYAGDHPDILYAEADNGYYLEQVLGAFLNVWIRILPKPVLFWDFASQEAGTTMINDSMTGNTNYTMELFNGAQIIAEGLDCSGGFGQTMGNIPSSVFGGDGAQPHSLEATFKITSLSQFATSPIAIDSAFAPSGAYNHDQFDAIVFNEYNDQRFLFGSDGLRRSLQLTTATPETSMDEFIHFVITNDPVANSVTLYRNGQIYGDSYAPNAGNSMTFDAYTRALVCIRSRYPGCAPFVGVIRSTAVYDQVLSPISVSQHYTRFTGISSTFNPTRNPSVSPTQNPSAPSSSPTANPSSSPTTLPSSTPTIHPSLTPSNSPSAPPSLNPSGNPSFAPTINPSANPSRNPSTSPTEYPSLSPSSNPSASPTQVPTGDPTSSPSKSPLGSGLTHNPSATPTSEPSRPPLLQGITHEPSLPPTFNPSGNPSRDPTAAPTEYPSLSPSSNPSALPTQVPTGDPTPSPSKSPLGSGLTHNPSANPTSEPSNDPSISPTSNPSSLTTNPTATPSSVPTPQPSRSPLLQGITHEPSLPPTFNPSRDPTAAPTDYPSVSPSSNPSVSPSNGPSLHPSAHPSLSPSQVPTGGPTTHPSMTPTAEPSRSPSDNPSLSPTSATQFPSIPPTQNPTLAVPIKRHFVMVLTGDFDEFQRYLNSTNVTKAVWAKGLIKMMINVAIYPQLASVVLIIHSVQKGSVIIDYSLEIDVDVVSLLDLAEQNINATVEINVHANLTMPVASNARYTLNPTTHPTAVPTTAAPSQSPTVKPTKSPLKPGITHNPTTIPTKEPTGSPTVVPTHAPTTRSPSTDPTVSPTFHPTQAPTPQDIQCNHAGITETETDGTYEYFLHINEQSIVRFDTCRTLALFDIFIEDTNDTDRNHSCVECGSICYEPSQYQVALSVGKYRMDIHGPHAFKMICTPKPDSDAPTSSPITFEPTKTPTGYPTANPTTSRPTQREHPVFNVSFPGDGGAPLSRYTFLGDPYGRFEAYIEVVVYDADSVLGVTALCAECFVWQYRLQDGIWTDIAHANDDDISVYNQQITSLNGLTTYQSRLTIQSIRRLNAGRCVDENDNARLFKPGNRYELRLQFVVDRAYFVSAVSNALSIETNTLPSGGFCVIQDFDHLEALTPYNLFCAGWDNDDNLEYNALLKDVLMSTAFVDDARKLQSVAPVGSVSITVMIKERNVDNAMTCYPIHAAFKSIADTIDEKLKQNTSQNASSIVNDILDGIGSITDETSFSDNPDVAVSIVTVIGDIYAEDLTTQNEAAKIVDDIVSNILDGSGVLNIVINVKNNTNNVSWVVLEGEDIITELTAISSITSNEDIVDAETTTTVLVDMYLPQIFEAIDVFVDVNTDDNKTSKQSVIQDQLYNIAGQSQQLIENLESTLQATLEAVTVDRDESIINETAAAEMVDNLNNLAQSLVDYATLAASKALSKSDVGETFNYETTEYNEDGTIQNTKTIIATKFDANIIDFNDEVLDPNDIILPKCGNEQQNIELPLSFMQQQDGVFDCAFMASSRNNFVSKQNRTQESDTVSINIYNDDDSNNNKPNEYESNACFPYLITMGLVNFNLFDDDHDMSLGAESAFPSCDFWNVSDSLWDTAGCFVYDLTNTTVTCGCTHLTTFSISHDEIVPEANILTEIDWKEFTLHNLYHYPTVWLTCLSLFIVFVIICWINPRSSKINTRSIMAFEDIIYKSVQEEKLWQDISGKEIKYITDYMPNQHLLGRGLKTVAPTNEAKKSVCQLQWRLYRAYLRNDHTLVSVFQRTAGTNFSLKQRLGCFFMFLTNIMVVTGTFYGLEQSNPVQDILASFIISLCGTLPVMVVRKFFEKSKPLEVKSTKHILQGNTANMAELEDSYVEVDVDSPKTPDDQEAEGNLTTMVSARASAAWNDWDIGEFMQRGDLTIADFNAQITQLYDQENKEQKIRAISDIRKALFDTMFPLKHTFKRIGWIVLVIWSLAACVTAIVYGFKFDIDARAIENTANSNLELYRNDDCWNTTLALQIEVELSKKAFQLDYIEQQAKNASSYAGGDAKSWLLSILQSLLTSLILWQPLTVYVVTWMKIWMFSWHLKMQVGPGNVVLLCKRCCCGYDHPSGLDEEEDKKSKMQMISQYLSRSKKSKPAERRSSHKIRDVVANKNRPVDIISFLGNEEWIIDDTTNGNATSVKDIGDKVTHQASDSSSLSNQNVDSKALVTVEEGEEVELQAITQIKSTSGSAQSENENNVVTKTAGGKGTKDEVTEEDPSDDHEQDVDLDT